MIPDARTMVKFSIIQGFIAHKVARSQAYRGVTVDRAALHAVQASDAIMVYIMLVLPVTLFNVLILVLKPDTKYWFSGVLIVLGVWIFVRMKRWVSFPASQRILYRIPSWLVVTAWLSVLTYEVLLAAVGFLFATPAAGY